MYYLSHGVVDVVDAAIAVWMIGGDFSHSKKLVHGMRQLEQMCSLFTERRLAGHPQSDTGMYLLTNARGAFSREFRSRDGVHVGAPAEPTREENNVAAARGVAGRGPKLSTPTATPHHLLARPSRLVLEATTIPPPRTDTRANPSTKASSIESIWATPRWREGIPWQACIIRGCISKT